MSRIFVDTSFYIALLKTSDPLHSLALELDAAAHQDELFTSDPVLTEVLNHFAGKDTRLRTGAWEFVELLRREGRTTIIPSSAQLFDAGLDLYRRRPDKGYGHTDCMSMAICREHGIRQVLTHDRHFAQEGFNVLL